MEEYVEKFRIRNTYVPEQFYGKLAKLENIVDQESKKMSAAAINPSIPLESESRRVTNAVISAASQAQVSTTEQPKSGRLPPPKLTVTLRRTGNDDWTLNQTAPNPDLAGPNAIPLIYLPSSSVAENVTSFLSGIRATFRSDNKNVMPKQQQLKNNRTNDISNKSYEQST